MIRKIILVTGGARSGKSNFALREATARLGKRAFVATAVAGDAEMAARIERHRQDRGDQWDTYEEPLEIGELVRNLEKAYGVILIDCLTLWLANVMTRRLDEEAEMEKLLTSLASLASAWVYIVSNEVGSGIVPDNELARSFRDKAGILNQKIAGLADEVYLTVAGLAVQIKGEK